MNRTPRAAYLCLLGLALVMPLVPVEGAWVSVKPMVFVALASAGALFLWADARRGAESPRLGTPTDVALGAWIATALLSMVTATNPGLARYDMGIYVALALTYVLTIKSVRTPRDVSRLFGAVLAAGVIISLLGLDAYLDFEASGEDESRRSAELDTVLFAHSYLAAQYLVMVLVGGLVLVLERGLSWLRRGLLVVALTPIAGFLLVVGSRGAYMAVALALVVSSLLRAFAAVGGRGAAGVALKVLARGAVWTVLLAVALTLAIMTGIFESAMWNALDRVLLVFDPEHSDFNFSRLGVWTHSLAMTADHLLLGVGIGGFDTVLPTYHPSGRPIPHAHNQFVHVMAETGLVGIAAFLFLLRHARRAAVKGAHVLAADTERRAPFHAAVAALTAAAVYFLFETPLHWVEAGSLVVILLALMTRAGCTSRDGPTPVDWSWGSLAAVLVALAVAAPVWADYVTATRLGAEAGEQWSAATVLQLEGDTEGAKALHEEALANLLEAEEVFPHRADFIAQAAEISFLLGDIEEALRLRRVADERVPNTFWHMNAIGKALMRLGRPEDAIDYLRDAMAAHDRPVRALNTYVSLGRAYSQTKRFEAAWLIFTDLIHAKHYQTVQPKILLDAINVHIQLDRDLFVAAVMMKMYEELVPEAERDKAYPFLSRHLEGMRNRPKRATVVEGV